MLALLQGGWKGYHVVVVGICAGDTSRTRTREYRCESRKTEGYWTRRRVHDPKHDRAAQHQHQQGRYEQTCWCYSSLLLSVALGGVVAVPVAVEWPDVSHNAGFWWERHLTVQC